MRCSAQSDAGSAADPEWEAVLAQLLSEEAELQRKRSSAAASSAVATTPTTGGTTTVRGRRMLLCRVWLRRWTSRSSVGTSGLAPLVEDSVCCRRLPPSMGYHSCDCIEEGFNIQQTGIEGDRMSASDVSSVPIVTNQSPPLRRSRSEGVLNRTPLPAVLPSTSRRRRQI